MCDWRKLGYLSMLMLLGCSAHRVPSGRLLYSKKDVVLAENRLAIAAESIDKSLSELAEIEKSLHAKEYKNLERDLPESFELQQLVTLDWNGPVENLLDYLAKAVNFRFNRLGKLVGTPILITITVKNAPVNQVLKNINLQCGQQANVVINPKKQLIELHYLNK